MIGPDDVRGQFEAEWPPPDHHVDPTLPKPWCAIGYSGRALENVLRVDYGASRERNDVFQIPGGEVRRIYEAQDLHGRQIGTLFVLFDPHHRGGYRKLYEALDLAERMGAQIVSLESGPVEGKP